MRTFYRRFEIEVRTLGKKPYIVYDVYSPRGRFDQLLAGYDGQIGATETAIVERAKQWIDEYIGAEQRPQSRNTFANEPITR